MPIATRPIILLVEDEPAFRVIYRAALKVKEKDYQIIEAEDGEQALRMAKVYNPSLILLDLSLPKLSGYDVLARLKQDRKYQHIPVLVYSVLDDKQSIDRAIKLGAADYTIKGQTPNEVVLAKVETLLGHE